MSDAQKATDAECPQLTHADMCIGIGWLIAIFGAAMAWGFGAGLCVGGALVMVCTTIEAGFKRLQR
jgi:hypothetical protein